MTSTDIFLCGAGGCIATDIVHVAQYYNLTNPVFPVRYKKPLYYFVRFLVAIIGGNFSGCVWCRKSAISS
jgi:hypothetical protein